VSGPGFVFLDPKGRRRIWVRIAAARDDKKGVGNPFWLDRPLHR